ncbi:MAG: D-2-hydroxyacid dehydrogenase [Armatimonadota bacterium]
MSFKLVLLEPVNEERWAEAARGAVPEAAVVVCRDAEQAAAEIVDADAAFGTVPPELLARAGRLRWLQAPQAGPPAGWYYPELVAHPVTVTNFRGIFNDHLGAHILSFVLAFARGLHVYLPRQLRREWRPGAPLVHLPEATAILVGVGGIGGETARLLAAFGVTVLAVDPRQTGAPEGVAELHPPDRLDHLLPRADFVISTAPETPETQRLFDRERLRRMKRSAYLINISRGALVVLDDLVAALEAGEIAGAALDVFEQEPLPAGHPLWTLPGVLITPHVGGEGPYLDERRAEILAENCRRFAAGESLRNVVDKANWF